MKTTLLLLVALAAVMLIGAEALRPVAPPKKNPITKVFEPLYDEEALEMIATINADASSTWTAGVNENFKHYDKKQYKRLLGTRVGADVRVRLPVRDIEPLADLPVNFTITDNWAGSLGPILNQAECGSCWAFGCIEAFSDRLRIASNCSTGAASCVNVTISAMDLVTCDRENDGCNGGDPGTAWSYAKETGLVTEPCDPYTIPTCPPAQQPCLNFVPTPACVTTCTNGANWNGDKHFVESAYGLSSNAAKIQTEIFTHGSVEAAFTVYADFVHYKSGVYQHKSGSALGGHAVKVVGWGVEANTPYWLVANSWTTTWGDNGFFKILRGSDECGIEDDMVAGLVKL